MFKFKNATWMLPWNSTKKHCVLNDSATVMTIINPKEDNFRFQKRCHYTLINTNNMHVLPYQYEDNLYHIVYYIYKTWTYITLNKSKIISTNNELHHSNRIFKLPPLGTSTSLLWQKKSNLSYYWICDTSIIRHFSCFPNMSH